MSNDDLAVAAPRPSDIVVVTGGEPLSQPYALLELATTLQIERPRLHVETAAVNPPLPNLLNLFETIVVSPKLRNAGPIAFQRANTAALEHLATLDNAWFKFVVTSIRDLDEIAAMEARFQLRRVMVMAEGASAESSLLLTRTIADEAINRGWSVTPRLHILLWENRPGR